MSSSSSSITFKVSDKTPECVKLHRNEEDLNIVDELCKWSKPYRKNYCTEVLQYSDFNSMMKLADNGFVDTVFSCYNSHHNLILRPDDVWTAIMVQFSFYVNKEAEKFRGKFVDFEGKKTLSVGIPGTLRTAPYSLFVKLMTKEIDRNLVDPDVKSWILPAFSTTTDTDLVTCGIVFMATMKKYFDYVCYLTCGIPNVTLEGTVEDWENILLRLKKLKEYELKWWYDLLKPIVKEMVNSRKGNPDIDFWQKICNHISGGSGPSYLSGWITAFCVFDVEGNKQGEDGKKLGLGKGPWPFIETSDIPTGSVEVDVKIIEDDGTENHSVMFAGHMAQEIRDGGFTLKPVSGWAMCLKPSPEEIEKIKAERKTDYDSDDWIGRSDED